jgi:hypothetical protein
MSGILSKPSMPAPQPVPVNPVNDPAAEKSRLDAERAALAERKGAGRAGTVAAGGELASTMQAERGLMRKRASTEMLG